MKNILVIGLASLVLFGVSAGLSVWLQTNSKTSDTAHADEKKKKSADDHGESKDKSTDKDHADPHKSEEKDKGKTPEVKPVATAKDADRMDYRRLQMDVVAADLGEQMQEYDRLVKKVGAEMKILSQSEQETKTPDAKPGEKSPGNTTPGSKKEASDTDDAERANIARIAALADQMPAETAAGIIQQLADSGKTDTAVKVLLQMKERSAAKVLAAITDPTVPPLLIERMQTLKRPATIGTP